MKQMFKDTDTNWKKQALEEEKVISSEVFKGVQFPLRLKMFFYLTKKSSGSNLDSI